jgi:hypothetical protein
MRTTGQSSYYCLHCGFDCTPAIESKTYADEECPARDGDFCEPKLRMTPKVEPPKVDSENPYVRMHHSLYILLADYLNRHPGKVSANTTVLELMEWSATMLPTSKKETGA